ncbi:MAG: DNA polymerase III subunit gamma/tau [Gammaproteobacteria bacterium]|nr:DNA polymerase III subunit gamma/tau [Gammaproteobacteria bacterium]
MANKKNDGPKSGSVTPPPGGEPRPYVVLARKYRPRTFDDMIGQDALVQTLRNAFRTGRIAQGYMLTGVRGIGKTTTARILARALNYEREGVTQPTVDMPEPGRHCAEIMDSRHPDVIEMDAASNTGIDDVREIIENARYKPLVARYKVFIIDEVHMLSKSAFNALLKTLEEPPEHVKFIFATTEIRKVPVTVLSRCQRFDLRRIDSPVLVRHFQKILAAEGAEADDDALVLIARAAEGSVRDGLSILDQAIAMGQGKVHAADVRAMLGLADRGRILDLLELVLAGKTADALDTFGRLHRDGAEPLQVLVDLGEAVHTITRAKVAGVAGAGESLSREERSRAAEFAGRLSLPLLSRVWQMLVKGTEEAGKAPNAATAAEMVLIRIAHTADLPSPDEVIRLLGGMPTRTLPSPAARPGAEQASSASNESSARLPQDAAPEAVAAVEPPPPGSLDDYGAFDEAAPLIAAEDDDQAEIDADIGVTAAADAAVADVLSFADVVALVGRRRDAKLKVHLEEHVSLVKFDAALGAIELHLLPAAPPSLANELRVKLNEWTGRKWMVALSKQPGERPIGEVEREARAAEIDRVRQNASVTELLKLFPDARIIDVAPLPGHRADDSKAG